MMSGAALRARDQIQIWSRFSLCRNCVSWFCVCVFSVVLFVVKLLLCTWTETCRFTVNQGNWPHVIMSGRSKHTCFIETCCSHILCAREWPHDCMRALSLFSSEMFYSDFRLEISVKLKQIRPKKLNVRLQELRDMCPGTILSPKCFHTVTHMKLPLLT